MKGLRLAGINIADSDLKRDKTVVYVGQVPVGEGFVAIAGPCSVENESQIIEIATAVKNAGASILRGGAFKPRTSPYSFQGLGKEGLEYLAKAREITGLPVISEVMDSQDVSLVGEYVDAFQIGSRNMQNYSLLKAVGKTDIPVMLKRGMSATLEEWLNAAEYVLSAGNERVILCERGIRSFDSYTRNTLDLAAIPALKELTHLPVIVDPSHGTGRASLIEPMSLAAYACGAAGLMIEVHTQPEEAVSDKDQTLAPHEFSQIMTKVKALQSVISPQALNILEPQIIKTSCQIIELEETNQNSNSTFAGLDTTSAYRECLEIVRDHASTILASKNSS